MTDKLVNYVIVGGSIILFLLVVLRILGLDIHISVGDQ